MRSRVVFDFTLAGDRVARSESRVPEIEHVAGGEIVPPAGDDLVRAEHRLAHTDVTAGAPVERVVRGGVVRKRLRREGGLDAL
jgi:hypothetical protein